MSLRVGQDCKLYHNTGTNASPVWVLIPIVGDVTIPDFGAQAAEVNLRVSNWILNLPTKLKAAIEFMIANDIGGTVWTALRTAAHAKTIKQFAVASGAIATSGTEYFKAFCFFEAFPWNQPIGEMSSHDARLALAYYEESSVLVEPSWVVVS